MEVFVMSRKPSALRRFYAGMVRGHRSMMDDNAVICNMSRDIANIAADTGKANVVMVNEAASHFKGLKRAAEVVYFYGKRMING